MSKPTSEIKERLKKALSLRQINPIELSEKTGIPKSSISQYMSGYAKPKQDRIYLISNALNINEAWLMGFDIPMERTDNSLPFTVEKVKQPKIMQFYDQLNDKGKHEAVKRVEELTYIPQYTHDLSVKAAHNDHLDEEGEYEKIKNDLSLLKRPNK